MKASDMNSVFLKLSLVIAVLVVAAVLIFGFANIAHAAGVDDKIEVTKTYTATVTYKKELKDELSMIETQNFLSKNVTINKDIDGTFRVNLFMTAVSEKLNLTILNGDGTTAPKLQSGASPYPFFQVTATTLNNPIIIKTAVDEMPVPQTARVFVDASSIKEIPDTVNKQHLDVQIVQAEESAQDTVVSKDGTDVATDKMWTTSAVRTEFNNAIKAAKAVYNNDSATQEQVDDALNMLGAAISKFDGAKKPGTAKPASKGFKRLGGLTAYGTMDLIVREGWSHSDRVIIATFNGFWDALAASSLAGLYDAPILVTWPDRLDVTTAKLIKDLGAREAYIVGGPAAISDTVKNQVRNQLIGDKKVVRYYGNNAQLTAIEVAKAKEAVTHSNTCLVATSRNFQDALVASPFAFDKLAPIFLTDAEGNLSPATIAAIKACKFDTAVIVGGPAVVQSSTEGILTSQCGVKKAVRKWGNNAYETSLEFARYALGQGMLPNYMGVATINDFYDALTGGPLCGKNGGVMVLASDENTKNTVLAAENKGKIATGYIFGGPKALNAGVEKAFSDAAA